MTPHISSTCTDFLKGCREDLDNLIKNKANEINRNLKLEFNKTKIYLEPKKFNLAVKLKTPRVLIKNSDIELFNKQYLLILEMFCDSFQR